MTNSLVTFDENCYFIDGKPVWLLSGEIHYFKLTRGDWRRRLVQLKCAGFNTVSVYIPWNYHELEEGKWDFSANRDIEHFLQLANEIGLYVVARPGPYICDEWHGGGLPGWLSSKKGLRLRSKDPRYLKYVDKWFAKIIPLIEKYQLGRQGSIIMAQVENEYGHFGEFQEKEYIYHLRDNLLAAGISVPIINCDSFINFSGLKPGVYKGINLCANFGGDAISTLERARQLQPDAPVFVTEFWIAAFDWWGKESSAICDDAKTVNGALEIAAGGAAGLTAFVFSGGTHFGYWHGCSVCSDHNFMTTLYGPGAPILDDGQFSPKYQLFKNRLSPLASDIFAQAGIPDKKDNGNILKTKRTYAETEFDFLINTSEEQVQIAAKEKEQACVDTSIPAGQVNWSLKNYPLNDNWILKETNLNIFSLTPNLVLFGAENSAYAITLTRKDEEITLTGTISTLPLPELKCAKANNKSLPLLLANNNSITNLWKINFPGKDEVIIGGPDRIEDMAIKDNMLKIAVSSSAKRTCWQLDNGKIREFMPDYSGNNKPAKMKLNNLRYAKDFPESQIKYDDSSWFKSATALPMAYFGNGMGRAWYRATFSVQEEGPQMLYFSGASDRALIFIDGEFLGDRGLATHKGWNVMKSLPAGKHTIAILAENLGMMNSGAEFNIPLGEPKGIYGPVYLNGNEITNWAMRQFIVPEENIDGINSSFKPKWRKFTEEKISGPAWVSGEFQMPDEFSGSVRIELAETSVKGQVWLNSHNIGRYWNLGPQLSLWLPLDILQQNNQVLIFAEEAIAATEINIALLPFGYQANLEIK